MAVQLKSDGYGLLGLIGVSTGLINLAKDAGVTVEQPFPGSFYVKHNGKTYGSVAVKGQAITLAKSGSLGPASKEALNSQFTSALKSALQSIGIDHGADSGSNAGAVTGKMSPSALATANVPKSKVAPGMKTVLGKGTVSMDGVELGKVTDLSISLDPEEGEAKPYAGNGNSYAKPQLEWGPDPVTEMTSGTLTTLGKAFKLYQPVYGTSGGSVYITVALLEGAQMAGRIAAGKLSLRMEGPGVDKYTSPLADLGFGFKAKDGYASVHYDIQDEGLMLKTFGAVLGRLGINKVKECADILLIKGYGK